MKKLMLIFLLLFAVDASAQTIREEVIPNTITRNDQLTPTGESGIVCLSGTPGPTFQIALCSSVDLTAKTFFFKIPAFTVATLPANGSLSVVTDGTTGSDCVIGGGTTRVLCEKVGSSWLPLGGGSGSGVSSFSALAGGNNTSGLFQCTGDCRISGNIDAGTILGSPVATHWDNKSTNPTGAENLSLGYRNGDTWANVVGNSYWAKLKETNNVATWINISQVASQSLKVNVCEIVYGSKKSTATALASDEDQPAQCGNLSGVAMTITEVKCFADGASMTVRPIITNGSSSSILTADLACGNGSFGAAGTLNGSPIQADGSSIDGNIATAGGAAKYAVLRIKRVVP